MKKVLISQFIVLLIGTVFAWGNFAYELSGGLEVRAAVTGESVQVRLKVV